MAFDETGYLSANGISLYWERYGQEGPLLVFVPGGMGTAYAHVLNAQKLSKRFRVVIFDRRGYARTRKAFHPSVETHPSTTVRQNAEDAAAVIRHFARKDESALVYGSCFGGAVVLELVQKFPHLVKLAIVHEPVIPKLVSDPTAVSTFASVPQLVEESGFSAGSQLIQSLLVTDPETQILRQSSNYGRLTEGSREHLKYAYTQEAASLSMYDVDWDKLGKQKAKLILARGELSDLPLVKVPCERVAAHLGQSVVLTPGGHFPFSCDRDRTLAQIDSLFSPAISRSQQQTNHQSSRL